MASSGAARVWEMKKERWADVEGFIGDQNLEEGVGYRAGETRWTARGTPVLGGALA
jgi:hypothetical protein